MSLAVSLDSDTFDESQLENIEKYIFVVDTSTTQNFIEETIECFDILRKNGRREWREVLCQSNIPKYLSEVQEILTEKGYLTKPYSNSFSKETKNALQQFQRENHLPIGQLDIETLQKIGIRF